MQCLPEVEDKDLVDLKFGGSDLDFLYLLSEKHLYKVEGELSALGLSLCLTESSVSRPGSYREGSLGLRVAARYLEAPRHSSPGGADINKEVLLLVDFS